MELMTLRLSCALYMLYLSRSAVDVTIHSLSHGLVKTSKSNRSAGTPMINLK